MTAVVFETPGLIDIRAFTLMGVSAKPNSSNPIGKFGTGLKYAVAVLVRLGAEPIVWIGKDKYTFSKSPGEFRGVTYSGLRMRCDKFQLLRARYTDLPYTTDYGRNWEPWMVFRELESNTRDEAGTTWLDSRQSKVIEGVEGCTRIIVDLPAFEKAYEKRGEIFLEGGAQQGEGVQVLEKASDHIYWRGLQVHKPYRPPMMTYNFLNHLDLTEDRTLSAEFYAKRALGQFVVEKADEETITKIVNAPEGVWEHELELPKEIKPSQAFHNVMQRHQRSAGASAWNYYSHHDPRPMVRAVDVFETHMRPWRLENDTVVDAEDQPVFTAPYDYKGRWDPVARAILKLVNPPEEQENDSDD